MATSAVETILVASNGTVNISVCVADSVWPLRVLCRDHIHSTVVPTSKARVKIAQYRGHLSESRVRLTSASAHTGQQDALGGAVVYPKRPGSPDHDTIADQILCERSI